MASARTQKRLERRLRDASFRRWRMCGRKDALTLDQANARLEELQAQRVEVRHVYLCPYGEHYHVGHIRSRYLHLAESAA